MSKLVQFRDKINRKYKLPKIRRFSNNRHSKDEILRKAQVRKQAQFRGRFDKKFK